MENYTVSVTPNPSSGDSNVTLVGTMIEMILNYNVKYTVQVVASNCARSSDPSASLEFTLGM